MTSPNPLIAHAVAAALAAPATDVATAARIQLMPMGDIPCVDGRQFKVADVAAAQLVIDRTREALAGRDLVIDYDHHSEDPAKTGALALAAGWVDPKTLTAEADGIYGEVTWTDAAAARLAAREYRYFSPSFLFDKAKNVLALLAGGLVNRPAMPQLAAIASAQESDIMDYSAIAEALGLAKDATCEAIVSHIKAMKPAAGMASQLAIAAATFKLGDDASLDDVLAAATAAGTAAAATGEPDPAKFVPIAVMNALQADLATLKTGTEADAATTAVEAAIAAGKVIPAQKDWAVAFASRDKAGFDGWVATAAVVIKPGAKVEGGTPPANNNSVITDAERATCAMIGVSEADFLKSKAKAAA